MLKTVGTAILVALLTVVIVAVAFGAPFLIAWVCDIVYSNIFETPTSNAPQISYWYWVAIVFIFEFFTGRGIRVERKVN